MHQGDDPHAEVEFYTSNEFMREIIHAYYEDLGFASLPMSMEQFERDFPGASKFDQPEKAALFDKLKKLHAGVGEYRALLSQAPKRISVNEVREYVSQEDGRKRYVAVRCANIHVPFPNLDVTGLAIVDLPGLGEIAKGHSEKLVNSLQREIDAVILVKRPSSGGDDWFAPDIKVFNEIKKAMPELDLADWLFVVLNDDGTNAKQVEILRHNAPQIGSAPRLMTVNCSNKDSVQKHLFHEVLQYLEHNLEQTDRQLIKTLSEQATRVTKELMINTEKMIDKLQKNNEGNMDFEKFMELFEHYRKELRSKLENLTKQYSKKSHENKNDDFLNAVNDAVEYAKAHCPLPEAQTLEKDIKDKGDRRSVAAEHMHNLRTYLTSCFSTILDKKLIDITQEPRRTILKELFLSPIDKLFPNDIQVQENPDLILTKFEQLLDANDQPTLLNAARFLREFNFSYQSHIHYRVREKMNILDPQSTEGDYTIKCIIPANNKDFSGEAFRAGLKHFFDLTANNVRDSLKNENSGLLVDPIRACFSMVEEAKDQLARAKGIEKEWRMLLYPRRSEIWPEEFNRFAKDSEKRKEWQTAIKATETIVVSLNNCLS